MSVRRRSISDKGGEPSIMYFKNPTIKYSQNERSEPLTERRHSVNMIPAAEDSKSTKTENLSTFSSFESNDFCSDKLRRSNQTKTITVNEMELEDKRESGQFSDAFEDYRTIQEMARRKSSLLNNHLYPPLALSVKRYSLTESSYGKNYFRNSYEGNNFGQDHVNSYIGNGHNRNSVTSIVTARSAVNLAKNSARFSYMRRAKENYWPLRKGNSRYCKFKYRASDLAGRITRFRLSSLNTKRESQDHDFCLTRGLSHSFNKASLGVNYPRFFDVKQKFGSMHGTLQGVG